MTPESVLAAGRAAHAALMLDACLITRSGVPVWDPAAGTYTTSFTTVYTGSCRVKRPTVEDVQAGDREVAQRTYHVALPQDAAPIAVGDVLTVTASTDEWLQGHPLIVTALELGSARTARWLTVEDRQG